MGPIFSLLNIVTQKNCLSWLIWVLKVLPRLTLIQEGGLHSLRLLLLMTEFSVFMPFRGLATGGGSWLEGVSSKEYRIIWKKKVLGDFSCTMVKLDRDGENKTQRLALSKLIVEMGLRIYGEGRTQIHLNSLSYHRFFARNPV